MKAFAAFATASLVVPHFHGLSSTSCPARKLGAAEDTQGSWSDVIICHSGKTYSKPMAKKRVREEFRHRKQEVPSEAAQILFADLRDKERLQKVISRLGVASRRDAESLILDGKVSVNGHLVKELGTRVDIRKDKIVVNGQRVSVDESVVWMAFHKPSGYHSTIYSPRGISRFLQNIPSQSLTPVSPIEDDASGLVLLTNERGVVAELSRPDNPHSKTWTVDCHGIVTQKQLKQITTGVEPKDGIGGIMRAVRSSIPQFL